MCVFVVKELVRYYFSQGSNIYVCFLDASMAFDRISDVILFKKLIARNVPLYIVRILWFWYRNQILFVNGIMFFLKILQLTIVLNRAVLYLHCFITYMLMN